MSYISSARDTHPANATYKVVHGYYGVAVISKIEYICMYTLLYHASVGYGDVYGGDEVMGAGGAGGGGDADVDGDYGDDGDDDDVDGDYEYDDGDGWSQKKVTMIKMVVMRMVVGMLMLIACGDG